MTITLKRLAHSDIEFLRTLRNANSRAFFTQRYITKTNQEDWWYKLQHPPPTIQFYSIWLNQVTPVGFLSVQSAHFVSIGGTPEVMLRVREIGNLLLAPAYRGRGIMAKALSEVRRLYGCLTLWIAHVKPNNTASLRVFERAGFWAVERPKGRRKCRTQPKN